MLGGTWGVMRKRGDYTALPKSLIEGPALAGELSPYMEAKGGDQDFLRQHVYPLAENDLIEHDSYHCSRFTSAHTIDVPRRGSTDIVGYPNSHDSDDALYHCADHPASIQVAMQAVLRGQPSPEECRPAGHKDWVFN